MANGDWSREVMDDLQRLRRQFEGPNAKLLLPALVVLLAVLILWSSWYTVQPEETAVVQRFGRVQRTSGPGLHFKIPLGIETVQRVPTARVLKEEFGFRTVAAGRQTRFAGGDYSAESLMLTGDLNVIDVQWIVQFRVEDPAAWTKPWSAEIPMKKADGPLYEYACHEGNYDLMNILSIARNVEAQKAAAANAAAGEGAAAEGTKQR